MSWQKPKPEGSPVQYRFPGLEQWQDRSRYLWETRNAEVTRIYKSLGRILNSHAPVLLRGERGAGKTVLAQALHHAGEIKPRALLIVHCANETEAHAAQAFAHARHEMNKAAAANGKHARPSHARASVTVLLRNVEAASPGLQHWLVRLLRGELENETHLAARVRLLATAAEEPRDRLRRDLYYRLSTYEFALPPLRARKEDLPDFVAHFLTLCARRHRGLKVDCSASALAAMSDHDWPGNIRELEQKLAHACETARGQTAMIEPLELRLAHALPDVALTKNAGTAQFETESALEISTA
jgi:DNA-binding NtrC family response regulator